MSDWVSRLSQILDDDPLIDEYAILPCASTSLFEARPGCGNGDDLDEGCVACEHKLAISLEAALVIHRRAQRDLRSLLSRPYHRGHEAGGAETDEANSRAQESASRAALLCGGADCVAAWACRERLLREGVVEMDAELLLNALLLRTNHKSGEAWAFRRHVLASTSPTDFAAAARLEQQLVEELAQRYDHHYYAWNHWAWVSRQLHLLAKTAGLAELPDSSSFPALAQATPSHYGLFHHRVTRLFQQLTSEPVLASGVTAAGLGEHAVPLADAGIPEAALEAYFAERQLSSALLTTFPHLEAPWAFRLQLLIVLLEGIELAVSRRQAVGPSPAAVRSLGELWRSDVTLAKARQDDPGSGDSASPSCCRRFARRFRAHALQELSLFLGPWGHRNGSNPALSTMCRDLGTECLVELEELETEAGSAPVAPASAPAVMCHVRAELDDLASGVCGEPESSAG